MTCKRAHRSTAVGAFAWLVAAFLVLIVFTPNTFATTPPLFLPAVTYSTGGENAVFPNGGGPIWIALADVNADARPDVLVANWCASFNSCIHGTVGVLLGNGDGTLQPAVDYDSGGYHAFSVMVADVNRDGKPDLLVTNGCADLVGFCPDDGSLGVLLGNGDGTFQAVRNYSSGGSTSSAALADLNGDGNPDVMVANCVPSGELCPFGNGEVGVLFGNGDGSFQPVATYDSGGLDAAFIAEADVNGDGVPDLLVLNTAVCNNCTGNVGVLLGRGDGTFQPVQTYGAGLYSPGFLVASDVNGDGALDLVVTEETGGGGLLAVLLGRGDGTFRSAAIYGTGGLYATPLQVADVNGDRNPDLLLTNGQFCAGRDPSEGCVAVLLGNGDGTFKAAATYDSGGVGAWWFTLADVDGDGRLDAIVANQCSGTCSQGGSVGVLLGNGDGTFQLPARFASGGIASTWVAAEDVNGDSQPDVLVANVNGKVGSIGVLLNNNQPLDTTPPVITLSVTPKVLWPPKGKMLPVTISGTITDTGSGVNLSSAAYFVTDEYGLIQPTGVITLGAGGSYSFTVLLQASRQGSDLDGRRYSITVRASDNAGNAGSQSTVVTVPHDQGN